MAQEVGVHPDALGPTHQAGWNRLLLLLEHYLVYQIGVRRVHACRLGRHVHGGPRPGGLRQHIARGAQHADATAAHLGKLLQVDGARWSRTNESTIRNMRARRRGPRHRLLRERVELHAPEHVAQVTPRTRDV